MNKYDFFYGNQVVEFERPEVPEVIYKKSIKSNIKIKVYSAIIKYKNPKVVVKNVCD